MDRIKLGADEIEKRLVALKGWTVENDMLKRRFDFKNFAESLAFVNQIGAIADSADHHPDITFGWGYAEIAFTTHDRGGITDIDFALAAKIDAIP
ncbi:MAG: 4a-hydroxytetrahydrobiopterin dehydratase [Candidatus Binatia bacterium]